MPVIKASADLRNKYSDISNYCHTTNEPIFITKNGQGDLAVMSIEQYDNMIAKIELYSKLAEGLKDIHFDYAFCSPLCRAKETALLCAVQNIHTGYDAP